MDPLTAASLAGTIVQLVDFSCKIVKTGRQLYHEGQILDNVELEALTTDFVDMIAQIKWTYNGQLVPSGLDENEKALVNLGKLAVAVARELVDALDKLKGKNLASPWSSVAAALRNVLGQDKIEKIVQRLDRIQAELQNRLLLSVRHQSTTQAVLQSKGFAALDSQSKEIIRLLLDQHVNVFAQLAKNDGNNERRHDLTDNLIRQSHNDIIRAISQLTLPQNSLPNRSRLTVVPVTLQPYNAESIQQRVLNHLKFAEMFRREEEVLVTYKETFKWILSDSSHSYQALENLMYWLRHGEGCYWINGKAASGKSTLMKFLYRQPQTFEALRGWAGSSQLVTCTFFFWNLGTDLQKTQLGIYRSILWSILRKYPQLICKVLPGFYNEAFVFPRFESHWNDEENRPVLMPLNHTEVKIAFLRLVKELIHCNTKLCIFVDGLDEYDGNHAELAAHFKDVASPSVKLVLSSRPIMACKAAFAGFPSLQLEELTRPDIAIYVTGKLNEHERAKELRSEDTLEYDRLVEDILDKAQGVFLWIILVVRSLVDGLINCDTINELRERLDDSPPELEDLYERMLDRMAPLYRKQAALYFKILIRSMQVQRTSPLTLLQMSFAIEEERSKVVELRTEPLSDSESYIRCKTADARITSRCCGLVESRQISSSSIVTFLHKSVSDFLQRGGRWSKMVSQSSTSGADSEVALIGSILGLIKVSCIDGLPTEVVDHMKLKSSAAKANPHDKEWALLYQQVGYFLAYCKRLDQDSGEHTCFVLELDRVMSATLQRLHASRIFPLHTWVSLLGLAPPRKEVCSGKPHGLITIVQLGMRNVLEMELQSQTAVALAEHEKLLPLEVMDLRMCADTKEVPMQRTSDMAAMLRMILDSGILVNTQLPMCGNISAWQQVIASLYIQREAISLSQAMIFIDLLVIAAEAGADPNALVTIVSEDHEGKIHTDKASARKFIHRLGSEKPQLMRNLQKLETIWNTQEELHRPESQHSTLDEKTEPIGSSSSVSSLPSKKTKKSSMFSNMFRKSPKPGNR